MGYYAVAAWRERRFGSQSGRALSPRSIQGGLVISWCGMRGIVTVAAALALPPTFPERDLIVFAAFSSVLATLVMQGLTLRPLLSRLVMPVDESVEEEIAFARIEAARAALEALAKAGAAHQDVKAMLLLEREYRARIDAPVPSNNNPVSDTGFDALRRLAFRAERARLATLRQEERIGDAAFHVLEEELDWAEAEVDDGKGEASQIPR
jgi:CPA1 family monovalent cation:H+ antiporter